MLSKCAANKKKEGGGWEREREGDTYRALEALAVVVVVESFNPSVTCFNREPTTHTLRRE